MTQLVARFLMCVDAAGRWLRPAATADVQPARAIQEPLRSSRTDESEHDHPRPHRSLILTIDQLRNL
jgi:hypothetical protein